MMQWLTKFLVKKYAVEGINKLLKKYDVQKATVVVGRWIYRLGLIINVLKKINDRLADGTLDEKEIDDSSKEVAEMISSF